ncbi:MAG: M18 family aminopeptidase [Lachnospiraceae bacterium]|nr:M18 family aminopeptidase [Lachnospiraceae bacterium]
MATAKSTHLKDINNDLLSFLDKTPNSFFAVKNISDELTNQGFERLLESKKWSIKKGGKYFVTRNDSAIIAFKIPAKKAAGFNIIATHTDSPAFMVKPNAEIEAGNQYIKLNVEKYGGMLCSTWLDRPLSVAGRVVINTKNGIETRLVNIDKNLMVIPNLCIHMNREANNNASISIQKDMLPIVGSLDVKGKFMDIIAKSIKVSEDDILDTDLYLYNREKGTIVGIDDEYISSGRLDDLQCTFGAMKGLLEAADGSTSISMMAALDNEEVGSSTKQGADSSFLESVVKRISTSLEMNDEDLEIALQSSFMISADNAHAMHPNNMDKSDPVNKPQINKGIVIKYSGNQKYATDAISGAILKKLCKKANVPFQIFTNNSDSAGGSTLGNISSSHLSINTVDIGLPQLAMHSSYELAGCKDTEYLISLAKCFYECELKNNGKNGINLK